MEEKKLFTITDKHLESGLRGYPIGYCITSSIDAQKGIFYRGQHISTVCEKEVEEVMLFIMEGKFPDEEELQAFKEKLIANAKVSEKVKEAVMQLPKEGHPMKLFASAVLIMGMYEGKGNIQRDFVGLLAKLPEVVAVLINSHAGWKETPSSQPELGYIKNFCNMIQAPSISNKGLFEEFMTLFVNLHMDNGGGNLCTFTAKAVASGGEDLYGSFAAALIALSGKKHGGANQNGLKFVQKVYADLGEGAKEEEVKKYIEKLLSNHKLIYGFGHAVLRCEDPRATLLFDFAKKHFAKHPLFQCVSQLKEVVPGLLKKNSDIKNPYSNIDSISGVILSALGFDFPQYFTVLFGLSRMTGVGRQIVYETLEARDGKGVPIYRPKYIYKEI